jgi:hypothetical protein
MRRTEEDKSIGKKQEMIGWKGIRRRTIWGSRRIKEIDGKDFKREERHEVIKRVGRRERCCKETSGKMYKDRNVVNEKK